MTTRIAVITDIHYSPDATPEGDRAKDIADIMLLRAVHYVNRFIQPDIALILGDVLDDGNAPGASEWRETLKTHLDLLKMPSIVLPGNHDGDVAPFLRDLEASPPFVDVAGARFVPFIDPEQPGYNAIRKERDMARLDEARADFDGPLVAVQHVPVFPPGEVDCPHNYTNAAEVWATMRRTGVVLAIAGHYHRGFEMIREDEPSSIAAPALCEFPYGVLEIEIDGATIRTQRHDMAPPRELGLVDRHAHTQMAYCGENMSFRRNLELAPRLGLAGIGLSEHADQLYYGPELFRKMDYIRHGMISVAPDARRVDDYLNGAREAGYPPESIGFEIDCDFHGNLVIDPADLSRAGYVIGAIHDLPEFLDGKRDVKQAAGEYRSLLEKFAKNDFDILAHPFRVFTRGGAEKPTELFEPTVEILKRHGIAAEINFHTNAPPPEFIRLCIDGGVPIALGTDSHNLYELGFFTPHLDLLKEIGAYSMLDEILWRPSD